MGTRVGIDLVSVTSVREAIERHADRYLTRVYAPSELADCDGPHGWQVERLAARFAAKEAMRKVLRAPAGVAWSAIAVESGGDGAPTLRLSGAAERFAAAAGIVALDLSLTHESELAGAVVIAETAPFGR